MGFVFRNAYIISVCTDSVTDIKKETEIVKKRILVMVFILIWAAADLAIADTDAAVSVVVEREQVIISGTVEGGKQGETVNILVTNPDADAETILQDVGGIQKIAEIPLDSAGRYQLQFPICQGVEFRSGYYTVYIRIAGSGTPIRAQFYFASEEEQKTAIALLNAANGENIVQRLDSAAEKLSVDSRMYAGVRGAALSNAVLSAVQKNPLSQEDPTGAKKNLTKIIVTEALAQGSEIGVFDANNRFLYTELFGLQVLDAPPKNLTVYQCYQNGLKEQGLNAVKQGLMGTRYDTDESMQQKFAQLVLIEGIRNYVKDGYGHIRGLLSVNGELAGLDLTNYRGNTDTKDRKLLSASCGTIEEIQRIMDKIEESNTGHTGGGFSGGGGGVVPVPDKTKTDSEINPEIEKTVHDEFVDMQGYDWAGNAVMALLGTGVVSRSTDKYFRPADPVTRAEFVKMLVLQFSVPMEDAETETQIFIDIPAGDWSERYIAAAYRSGIVVGKSEAYFGKDESISRQDMAVLVHRALVYTGWEPAVAEKTDFLDAAEIASYAQQAVSALRTEGIVRGMGDNLFMPHELCNRAQAAQLIYSCKAQV